jgi:hypothetical protein
MKKETKMLKFENVARVGDIIRAYDFKPCAGRDDAFIEGVVTSANNYEQGFKAFKVRVTADKFLKYETKASKNNRVGLEMFVPMETSFMEFDSRIINLSII